MQHETREILKVSTKDLAKAKWSLKTGRKIDHPGWYVRMGVSQLTRWLDEMRGNQKQFLPSLIAVVMAKKKDYDRANQGFTVNGIRFRRLLGTAGGIKKSTVFYIDEKLYPEIMRRITNGRDLSKELVPAKLEAYQALTCSGSYPVPMPRIIVVPDCVTHFRDDVTLIRDGETAPIVEDIDGYEIERNNSDGCGLMMPDYARRVNLVLNGIDEPIPAFTARYAWTKGILACFGFVEFAEKIAGKYIIKDIWGTDRDVRDADVILTESMLKLWDSYDSMESWLTNSAENGYTFSAAKIAPMELERLHSTNYQFLQALNLTDDQIKELCRPTVELIRDVLGEDWRKSILLLGGTAQNEETVRKTIDREDNTLWEYLALMANPNLIYDPHIGWLLKHTIEKTIERAAMGTLFLKANYAIIVGDLYALAQSAFGLPITGLLPAGEIYHRFWRDEGAESVACFRAPMICAPQIAKRKISYSDCAAYWFRFLKTVMVISAWDSTADRLSGADFDGDTSYVTDDPVILKAVKDVRPLLCQQKKAEKKIPTEKDIIEANKKAFGDMVGTICNRITAMFDVQAGFPVGSPEYNELDYRIKTGQFFVQNQIDAAKGVEPTKMLDFWYSKKSKKITPENAPLVADRKPYFMIYNYKSLREKHNKTRKTFDRDGRQRIGKSIAEAEATKRKTPEMQSFLEDYYNDSPTTMGECVINRIARYIEAQFANLRIAPRYQGDTSVYKYGVHVTKEEKQLIEELFAKYQQEIEEAKKEAEEHEYDAETRNERYEEIDTIFRDTALSLVEDERHLTDALVDICYNSEKKKYFAWKLAGRNMLLNVIRNSGGMLNIPVKCADGGIEYKGFKFKMEEVRYDADNQ